MKTSLGADTLIWSLPETMASSGKYPMKGKVDVEGFVQEGAEKPKMGRSYDSMNKKPFALPS